MTLVDSLSTTFDKVDFQDRYRDALMELVEKKIDGKQVISVSDEEVKQAPVVDIMDALKASIEEAKLKKKQA
jgi:DNA end-binding protein Ku